MAGIIVAVSFRLTDERRLEAKSMAKTDAVEHVLNPVASRPQMPGYGVPESDDGLLPWSHAEERLALAKNYWIATAGADKKPHAVPVWGAWLDGALYFGIGPRSSRNIAVNPQVSVHLENGDQVVIVEGRVEQLTGVDPDLATRLDDAFAEKYDWRPSAEGVAAGEGSLMLQPETAFAWTSFPGDATRWTFQGE
jgi:nitroimidazol reductase NimA-like FMN-containing flavoprotein (pyridoxamine 5'-phosphate oxidase superfamily)